MLYSDFTGLSADLGMAMELYSEFIPEIPRAGACFVLHHNVKAIDLKTDRYEVYLQTLGPGKWNVTAFKQTNLSSDCFRWPEPETTLELLANRSVWEVARNIDLCPVRVHRLDCSFDFACQLEKCIHFYRS